MIPNFKLNSEYITDVREERQCKLIWADGHNTVGKSIGYIDHQKFTEFRNKLELEGFIKTERLWNNGDSVLKEFKLNGELFKNGDQFPCASAMKNKLKVSNKIKTKSLRKIKK